MQRIQGISRNQVEFSCLGLLIFQCLSMLQNRNHVAPAQLRCKCATNGTIEKSENQTQDEKMSGLIPTDSGRDLNRSRTSFKHYLLVLFTYSIF